MSTATPVQGSWAVSVEHGPAVKDSPLIQSQQASLPPSVMEKENRGASSYHDDILALLDARVEERSKYSTVQHHYMPDSILSGVTYSMVIVQLV